VKFFSNTDHLKALAAGEVWVVVGWSPELLAAALKSANVGLSVPRTGTSLWADVWVVPAARAADKPPSPLVAQWLDFSVQVRTKKYVGDAKSLLGDAKSSLGDAKSLLGDA
jgi:spermidine/putrescine-binding protein